MTIVLAGSMLFLEKMKSLKQSFELHGIGVTLPCDGKDDSAKAIRGYNEAALERLQNAEVLLVVNEEKRGISGYIGSNTLIEIGMAFALHKPIYLLHEYDIAQDCADELAALVDGVVGDDSETWLREVMK